MSLSITDVIHVVLNYIGGKPVSQFETIFIKGKAAAYSRFPFLAGGLFSSGMLGGLLSAVTSGGLGAMLQNPLGTALGTLTSSVSGLGTTLNGLVDTTGGLGPFGANDLLSSGQLSTLTNSIVSGTGSLGSMVTDFTSHTNLLSGVIDNITGGLGLNNILAAGNIRSALGGIADSEILNTVTSLGASDHLSTVSSFLSSVEPQLRSVVAGISDPTARTAALNSAISSITGNSTTHTSTFNSYITSDTSSYNSIVNQNRNSGYIADYFSHYSGDVPAVKQIFTTVAKPDTLTTFAAAKIEIDKATAQSSVGSVDNSQQA